MGPWPVIMRGGGREGEGWRERRGVCVCVGGGE